MEALFIHDQFLTPPSGQGRPRQDPRVRCQVRDLPRRRREEHQQVLKGGQQGV